MTYDFEARSLNMPLIRRDWLCLEQINALNDLNFML